MVRTQVVDVSSVYIDYDLRRDSTRGVEHLVGLSRVNQVECRFDLGLHAAHGGIAVDRV